MKKENNTIAERLEAVENKLAEGYETLIKDVTEKTNTEYFGEKGLYGEKLGYQIDCKLIGDDTEFSQWYSDPDVRGLKSSNIYAFKQKYGSYPKKGMTVTAKIDENGFFKIEI